MNWLWTTADLVDAMDGRPIGVMPEGITGISIDTRTLARGEAFFAVKGDKFDGHDFATAAMAAGAGLLVVAEAKLPALGRLQMPKIVVEDVLVAMERLAVAARARTKAQIIAVTGSVGKTTTKEMLRHALAVCGSVHASEKSFNNHWGVPLSLARMPQDTTYGIFEIGMNHPGEITPLVKLVRPHIAIVTLIAAAHLGFFRSLDEIARAKAEIFSGVVKGGHAILNRDDPRYKLLARLAGDAGVTHIHGFGENARAQFRMTDYQAQPPGACFGAKVGKRKLDVEIGAPGRHMALNALAVLGAAQLAGADIEKAAGALATLKAEKGRGRLLAFKHRDGGQFTVIDESYNANPASMRAALQLLGATPVDGGRRIAVLGDMLELGVHSAKLHKELAGPIGEAGVDRVFLAGPEIRILADNLPDQVESTYREDADTLAQLLVEAVRPGDVVMIKSSNGIGFSRLVEALTNSCEAAS
ncbi:MAG: UDP-N-acetylmuramoylalanyl-D-glutamyl-2,6-diaminopimelate--D-alanyl-D-alanine ligase [Notoacmeibacter sp.]|nr:UDP-N-acetylmuramoylalanyl-D-glutamyl-2,6-diaminopimelate--D-alanyl-D-alanine ligase [Notoacmeibacter sp.]